MAKKRKNRKKRQVPEKLNKKPLKKKLSTEERNELKSRLRQKTSLLKKARTSFKKVCTNVDKDDEKVAKKILNMPANEIFKQYGITDLGLQSKFKDTLTKIRNGKVNNSEAMKMLDELQRHVSSFSDFEKKQPLKKRVQLAAPSERAPLISPTL